MQRTTNFSTKGHFLCYSNALAWWLNDTDALVFLEIGRMSGMVLWKEEKRDKEL